MNVVVLDTNIVSFLINGHTLGEKYRAHLMGKTAAISFMTVGELFEGAYRKGWSDKKCSELRDQLKGYIIIPFSAPMMEIFGKIRAARKRQPIAVDDALIAATALAKDCPLITHNPRDFANISGLKIITELSQP
ncbi:MAG TPA: type II toxin-antitoxin system VapC family toxin [bacterium]|nr:type II toxin-antitoxin system VapC family toxin [bacterium]